jgi:hypothetical protein
LCTRQVIFLTVLQYIIVLFRIFGKEWPNGRAKLSHNSIF